MESAYSLTDLGTHSISTDTLLTVIAFLRNSKRSLAVGAEFESDFEKGLKRVEDRW